jgi:hypothetical protein
MVAQDRRHVQVVGDHAQSAVLRQLARDGFGGGADVDDQRAAMRHGLRHRLRDALLGRFVEALALPVGDVLGGRARHAHATVKARQHPGFGQQAHVAPHGLQRDAEMFGQCLNRDAAVLAHLFDQSDLAGVKLHCY